MKITLDTKTLHDIKRFNPIDKIPTLGYYDCYEMQQVLIINAFVHYLKTQGLLKELEIEVIK